MPSASEKSEKLLRVVFMGTPAFAVPSLRALAQDPSLDVVAVLTRPDAVRSRGRALEPSPVKETALELGIPVEETRRITDDVLSRLRDLAPHVIAVAAFGCILPDPVLELAPLGCLNVHASLLPRWRGAAPIQRAILAGDERAGVSIMRIGHELDAGPWCRQASLPVGETGDEELTTALAELGAPELVAAVHEVDAGTIVWHDQDLSQVTFAPKVEKAEMLLNPADEVLPNARRVQASSSAAPARAVVAGRAVRVLSARIATERVPAAGVMVSHGRVVLGCVDGSLELLCVKPDGKRDMDVSSWAAGLRTGDGDLVWAHV